MPLSEDEQKILREIEAQLNATDPQLVDQVSRTTVYRHAGRNIRLSLLATILGLVLVITQFTNSTLLAVVGFVIMLGSLLVVSDNLKRMGKASLHDLFGFRAGVNRPGFVESIRERFRREPGDDERPR
jgi:hypothetical protein